MTARTRRPRWQTWTRPVRERKQAVRLREHSFEMYPDDSFRVVRANKTKWRVQIQIAFAK